MHVLRQREDSHVQLRHLLQSGIPRLEQAPSGDDAFVFVAPELLQRIDVTQQHRHERKHLVVQVRHSLPRVVDRGEHLK